MYLIQVHLKWLQMQQLLWKQFLLYSCLHLTEHFVRHLTSEVTENSDHESPQGQEIIESSGHVSEVHESQEVAESSHHVSEVQEITESSGHVSELQEDTEISDQVLSVDQGVANLSNNEILLANSDNQNPVIIQIPQNGVQLLVILRIFEENQNPEDMHTSIMCINILQNIKAVAPKL
jgi:hypothetical protein